MSEFDWLRIVYLLTALGLVFSTWRVHRLGGRRTLLMVLVWICIFMIVAVIAGYIEGWALPAPALPPSPGTDSYFT